MTDRLIDRLRALAPDVVAQERRALVEQLRARGWSVVQIAEACGVSRQSVYGWLGRG